MKRDWDKINFWMIWFVIFLIALIFATGILNARTQNTKSHLGYECAIRGLEYYDTDGLECIDNEGRTYHIEGIRLYGEGGTAWPVLVWLFTFGGTLFSFVIILQEYKGGIL